MESAPKDLRLIETPPPDDLLIAPGLLWWGVVGACVVLVAILALWLWMDRRRPKLPAPDPLAAYAAASAALEACSATDPRQAALEASLILRRYLATAVGEPSLYETHEQFVARHNSLAALGDELRGRVGAFLGQLVHLKYAAETAQGPDAASILTQTGELLGALKEELAR